MGKRWRGPLWGLIGLLMGSYALTGALGWAYRLTGNEPLTLTFGLLGCVLSLIGLGKTFAHQSGWWLVWTVVAMWVAVIGAFADGLLLWFGRTITGFY